MARPRLGALEHPAHRAAVEAGRLRRGRVCAAHDRGGGLVRPERRERAEGVGARALEQRAAIEPVAHGAGGVEHDGRRARPHRDRGGRLAGPLGARPRDGERGGGEEQRARGEQQDLADAQAALGLAAGAEDEVDRRERRRPGTPPEEEVDRDRDRRGEEAPEERGVEEADVHAALRSRRARNGRSTSSSGRSVRQSA